MSEPIIWSAKAQTLMEAMLEGKGCDEWGVDVAPERCQRRALSVAHDSRGAPYVVDEANNELTDTLVSMSDEEGVRAPGQGSAPPPPSSDWASTSSM